MDRLSQHAFVALVLICALTALEAGARRPQPASPRAPETVLFFDDFTEQKLDRAKWNVEVTGQTVNNEQEAYVDSPDTLRIVHGAEADGTNGALEIHPRYRQGFTATTGRKYDFTSGRINTRQKFEFTYGTAAARIKLTAGPGLWPAFWALGNGRWPDTGEIDVMENVGQPDWVSEALHGPGYFGNTPLANRAHLPADSDITAWHVYSVDWTPDSLVFKIDDKEVYAVTKPMVEKYGRWAYDNPKFLILNFALGGGYPEAINHAGPPYPGMPAATMDLLKADKVRMLVDWVKVTKG